MATDTSKITAAATTLGNEIANAIKTLDAAIADSGGGTPVPPDPNPAPDHPYEDFTTYYKHTSGTVNITDKTKAQCIVKNGDHSPWDAKCDFAGMNGPKFATGKNVHLDYWFKIEPGTISTGNWVICGEIHNDDDALGRSTSPPFSLHFDKDYMQVVAIAGGSSSSNDQWLWPYKDSNKIQRGHDYHIQVDAKFTQDGYLKVRRDGATLVDYKGNLGYGTGTYWVVDIYRSNTNPTTTETLAVDFWNMQVWTD